MRVCLTCGTAALVLHADWFFALLLGGQACAFQCAAAAVGHSVSAADLVVAFTHAHTKFVLLVRVALYALHPGAAAAGIRAAAAARLPFRGGAHRAAGA